MCLCYSHSLSQNIDSLNLAFKNAKSDTTKLRLLYLLSNQCEEQDILKYAVPGLSLADAIVKTSPNLSTESKNTILKLKGQFISNIGYASQSKSDYEDAINHYEKALKIFEDINEKKEAAITYNNLAVSWQSMGNLQKALNYYEKGLKIQEETNDDIGRAITLGNLGMIYQDQGNSAKALDCFFTGLKIEEQYNQKDGMAVTCNCIGGTYQQLGDIEKSLYYFNKSIQLNKETGNTESLAQAFGNIGSVYMTQDDVTKALEYFHKSLQMHIKLGRKEGISTAYNNIGACYSWQGNADKALEYYNKSLKIEEETGNKIDIARSLNNIGNIYEKKEDYLTALAIYKRSLLIKKELNDNNGLSQTFNNLGSVYFKISSLPQYTEIKPLDKKSRLRLASAYADSSLMIAKKIGFPASLSRAERLAAKVDSANGNFEGAFEHLKQFVIYRDSIANETTRKLSIKSQLKYEFDKKEAVIKEQQEKERAIAKEKNSFQQIVILSVLIGLLLVVVFAAFIFRSLKTTRHQKLIIEQKQKEILDSIRYAKRIQKSLLPTEKYLEKNLKQR